MKQIDACIESFFGEEHSGFIAKLIRVARIREQLTQALAEFTVCNKLTMISLLSPS
jgi:hypothetical protein